MDVRGPYPALVIGRVRPRLDGLEAKTTLCIRDHLGPALEIGIERPGIACVLFVIVAAPSVGLPDLHKGAGHWAAFLVQHASPDVNDLTLRPTSAALDLRQIGILIVPIVRRIVRTGRLGDGRVRARRA